jgi:hypothetical protein
VPQVGGQSHTPVIGGTPINTAGINGTQMGRANVNSAAIGGPAKKSAGGTTIRAKHP